MRSGGIGERYLEGVVGIDPCRFESAFSLVPKEWMLEHYLPIAVFAGLAVMVGVVPMILGYWLSPSDLHEAKQAPFECGFAPVGDANQPFDLRYYLVAICYFI